MSTTGPGLTRFLSLLSAPGRDCWPSPRAELGVGLFPDFLLPCQPSDQKEGMREAWPQLRLGLRKGGHEMASGGSVGRCWGQPPSSCMCGKWKTS